MKSNNIKTKFWFAWFPVKTKNNKWIWFKYVNKTIDENDVIYLGLLPQYTYEEIIKNA